MKTLKLFVLLVCFALAVAAGRPAPLSAAAEPVKAENVRFGYLVSDTNAVSGTLGSWCGWNSPASELFVLDTAENSIGLDLGATTAVTAVTVVGWDTMLSFDGTGDPNSRWKTRLNSDNVKLYYSDDNVAYALCSSYTTRSDTDTRMPHLPFRRFHFENLNIKARYIKVHCTLSDNKKWSWVNYQDRAIIAAGPKIVGSWFPQKAAPKHREYPWAKDCLPFGSVCERNVYGSERQQRESEFYFGVSSYHPVLSPLLAAKHYQGRILWRKVGMFDQKYFEPARGVYKNFDVFDKIIDIYQRYHIRMLGSFDGTAEWNCPRTGNWWDMEPENWKNYQGFVTKVVNYYKDRIKFWEGWNELEIPACRRVTDNQAGDYPSMADFVKLQKVLYDGIKTADPNAVVLNGGFCGWGLYFVERILSLGVGPYMDVCGFHPYSNDPNGVLEKVLATRDMLDYYGYVDMPIWLTEIGWSSGDWPAELESSLRVADEQTKARYLTEALDLLLPHIQVFMWYAACERMADEQQRMFGLFVPILDAEPPYFKENLAYTAYADYTKKWYKAHNIPAPPVKE
jgi:hypothetical protein